MADKMAAASRNVKVSKKPASKSTPAVSGKTKITKLSKTSVSIERKLTLKRGGSLK